MKAIPKSTATNAYELLGEVRDLILEEPRRIFMDTYVSHFMGEQVDSCGVDEDKLPECGTVGCIAGWLSILTAGARGGRFANACEAIGVRYQDNMTLHDAFDHLCHSDFPQVRYGTKAYAKHVARRISSFMKEFKTELLSHRVGGEATKQERNNEAI